MATILRRFWHSCGKHGRFPLGFWGYLGCSKLNSGSSGSSTIYATGEDYRH
jgi:hypothetical protein